MKPGGSNKNDDNFDWSKVIKLVFGWGASNCCCSNSYAGFQN